MNAYVYIIANKYNNVFYVGVTSNLIKRVWEHKNKLADGFSKKYRLNKLVYYEIHSNIVDAISREKVIKNWHRAWKIDQINSFNPKWVDLYDEILK